MFYILAAGAHGGTNCNQISIDRVTMKFLKMERGKLEKFCGERHGIPNLMIRLSSSGKGKKTNRRGNYSELHRIIWKLLNLGKNQDLRVRFLVAAL